MNSATTSPATTPTDSNFLTQTKMKPENIKKFLLIEASKLATDKVIIDTWEAETATKILEVYESRKKWCDEHEEEYSMRTSFQFRKLVVYSYCGDASTWHTDIEAVKEFANSEVKEIA